METMTHKKTYGGPPLKDIIEMLRSVARVPTYKDNHIVLIKADKKRVRMRLSRNRAHILTSYWNILTLTNVAWNNMRMANVTTPKEAVRLLQTMFGDHEGRLMEECTETLKTNVQFLSTATW